MKRSNVGDMNTTEGNPELVEKPEEIPDRILSMDISSADSENDGISRSPVAKTKKKKSNFRYASRETRLEYDAPEFDHLDSWPRNINQRSGGQSSSVGASAPAVVKSDVNVKSEEKKAKPRPPPVPNSGDYSKPLSHWMKPGTIMELREYMQEKVKQIKPKPIGDGGIGSMLK